MSMDAIADMAREIARLRRVIGLKDAEIDQLSEMHGAQIAQLEARNQALVAFIAQGRAVDGPAVQLMVESGAGTELAAALAERRVGG